MSPLAEDGRPVVRLMTWNIHGAFGRNPRFDLAAVIELVKRHAPDIVALQEIDSRRPRGGPDEPFEVLREALGVHAVKARAVSTQDGDYGQALISRWPLGDTRIHDLSYRRREPRRAISSCIETPGGPIRVVATHLGLTVRERRSQAGALLGLVGAADMTTAALGDFNDWLWAGSVHRRLAGALPSLTAHRTFPARFPLFRLDRIYLWPPAALIASRTDHAARHLSDHLPVISDVRLIDDMSQATRF